MIKASRPETGRPDLPEAVFGLRHGRIRLTRDIFQFKGGTLLRLCYFDDYRSSADVDLNLDPDIDTRHASRVLEEALDTTRDE